MTQPVVQVTTPTTGSTVSILNSDQNNFIVINPAADIASLIISFPSNPHNGQFVTMVSYKNIASFSLINGVFSMYPGALLVSESLSYIYNSAASTWMQTLDLFPYTPTPRSFNNAPTMSIVTSTGAVGTQLSTTRDTFVSYSPNMITTANISGNVSDVIVLEICATNSVTASDWKEIARVTNGQALTLAITLQSVQTTAGVLAGILPAGYYRKIRAITSGTITNSMNSGQEVLL